VRGWEGQRGVGRVSEDSVAWEDMVAGHVGGVAKVAG